MKRINLSIGAGCLVTLLAAPVVALPQVESRTMPSTSTSSLEDRLHRIEQRLGSSIQGDTLTQMSNLQNEVQELRGLVEMQEHEIQRLEKSQKTLFLSLEQELAKGQGKTGKVTPAKPVAATPTEPRASVAPTTLTTPTVEMALVKPGKVDKTEDEVFGHVQKSLKQKNYVEAEKNATDYLSQYPNGQFAPNTHYFLGEIYWTQWHGEKTNTLLLEKALHAFSDVSNGFSDHAKAKDALLKLGLIETERGNWNEAATYFKKVMTQYPNTPSAKIAELRIHKLEQEGRIS